MKSQPSLLVILLFSFFHVCAQTGTIKGVIKDSKTKEPLIGASVVIEGTTLGAATSIDGDFVIERVPAGSHTITISSISYAAKKFSDVMVEAGKATVINTMLDEEAIIVEGVTVLATRLTSTDVSIISEVKEAKAVVSAISGAQIAKTQDRDAAEVIRRVPGVTIIDNRFINVRGLSDRYNSVWLNDAASPSTEAEKKAFSFDIIPTAVIDRMLVYKSPSAELPGDFAGGMVKVYTRTSMPSNNWVINFSQGFRANSTFQNFNYNTTSSTDFLGFDDGTRGIPNVSPPQSPNDRYQNATMFKNTWGINTKKALPDLRFSVTKGSSFRVFGRSIESVSMLNYSNTYTVFNIARQDTDPDLNYKDNQSTNQVRLGALQNFGIRLNDKHKIEWRNLFNQIGTDQTTLREGMVLNPYEKAYFEWYQSRYVLSSQINGKHAFNEKTEYTWTAGYSHTHRDDPDLKRISYSQSPNSLQYYSSVPPGSADTRYGGRFYQQLNENVMSFTHNFLKKFDVGSSRIDLNVGNYFEYRVRDFSARSLGYILPPNSTSTRTDGLNDQDLKQLPIDKIFDPQYVGFGGFAMDEITNKSDVYHAENRLFASYLSVSVPFTEKLKLITGARVEYNRQSLTGYDISNNKPVTPVVEQVKLLPSANLSYNFSPKSLLRLTYGKSLNRPEFREWAPFYFYDFDNNVNLVGSLFPSVLNPQGAPLKVADIDNFDLRYELYPSSQELFHVGVFYKNFTNPIEQYVLPSSNRLFTFANANGAYAMGVEFDLRKNLGFLGTEFFREISLVANASFIKSEIRTDNGINLVQSRPLQGQSPYVINAGFYYQNDRGVTGSLTYNVFGPRIFLVGTKDYGSWGELPRNTIDIAINYPVGRKVDLTLAVQNLLNQPVQRVEDSNLDGKFERDSKNDLTNMKFNQGQYVNIGFKLTL